MMRKLIVLAMVAGLVGLGFARDSRAGVTIDLLFLGVNGAPIVAADTVTVDVGDVLTMGLFMSNDQTLTIAIFSTNYDLDGDNELDVVSAFQWTGLPINKTASDFFAPIAGFSPTTATFVGSFQGATNNLGGPRVLPAGGNYQMGTVTWKWNGNPTNDGADIISGLLNPGVDTITDAAFNDIANLVQFNSATVNFVPEPGTASLLGLGLVGLLVMGRRSRS